MTGSSSTAASSTQASRGLIAALVVVTTTVCIVILVWLLGSAERNPYIRATLDLQGVEEHGSQLFRMNCAGCHGVSAQGLVGPSLNGVSSHRSDAQLIEQIMSGQTPPMPSFQMEPQEMADLLSHLHNLT
ncbi:MAG: c-type cytochrome [Prochlorococcus sp.]